MHSGRDESEGDVAALGVSVLLAAWLCMATANNIPVSGYDRLRKKVPVFNSWIPNWRFFAPNPIANDNHLVYRLHTADGEVTAWSELELYRPRKWWYVVVHPGRRQLKALNDVINVLLGNLQQYPRRVVEEGAFYRLLKGFVRSEVVARHGAAVPRGFQFAMVRYSGYDDDTEPINQLLSGYEPLNRIDTVAAAT